MNSQYMDLNLCYCYNFNIPRHLQKESDVNMLIMRAYVGVHIYNSTYQF
jgi:hypothetical protein